MVEAGTREKGGRISEKGLGMNVIEARGLMKVYDARWCAISP